MLASDVEAADAAQIRRRFMPTCRQEPLAAVAISVSIMKFNATLGYVLRD